jgi:membrane-bound lytic murein transglycosylase MltF
MAESDLKPLAKSWVGARGIMQLMPSTFQTIQSARPEFKSIDDPQFNIAAGIMHDRYLWTLYPKGMDADERLRFMFAAYNAGEGTIKRARSAAEKALLDAALWSSVEQIAPNVKPWRYRETLGYIKTIDSNRAKLKGPRK